MVKLLYKELNLSINKFFIFVLPILTGALFLIPQWVFLLAPMYFFFITVPSAFPSYNAQRDNDFTIVLPVRKRDMVRSRIVALGIIELIHIAWSAVFALIHVLIYDHGNFMMDLNLGFFGVVFAMFGLFNITFFPIYYKTGYKYGVAAIVGIFITILFGVAVEYSLFKINGAMALMEGSLPEQKMFQAVVLILGIGVYILTTMLSSRISEKRFEKVDL